MSWYMCPRALLNGVNNTTVPPPPLRMYSTANTYVRQTLAGVSSLRDFEVTSNRTPHGTATGAQGLRVAHDDALLLGPGDGHVHTAAVRHEAREPVADVTTADRGDDDYVGVGSLAGIDLFWNRS